MFRKWLLAPVLNILKGINMNMADLANALGSASDQIQKGIQEVKDAVSNSGNTTPEVDAALARLQAAAQALDDLNPDAPPAGGGDTLPGGQDTTPGNP